MGTYQCQSDESIIPAEPFIHPQARVESSSNGSDHQDGEYDDGNEQSLSPSFRVLIIGIRPGQYNIQRWYPHIRERTIQC